MPKQLSEIMGEVSDLNIRIKQILYHVGFENYEDLSDIDFDRTDAEQLFIADELKGILTRLDDVSHTLNYLERTVKAEGVLHKNKNGRYEFNGIELSSGSGLEFLADDDRHCQYDEAGDYISIPYWRSSRIEHNGTDYYIVGYSNTDLEGLRVRIR